MDSPLALWQRMTRASGTPGVAQTLAYYAAFITLGMTTASLGPTLLGLANQTGSDLGQISFLFAARASGYLVGSFVGGRLYDRLPGHRTMAGAMLVVAVLLALVPELSLLWLLTAVLLLVGFMEGVTDVGGNALLFWVHREGVGPYMNGLHLFFAIGAFLAPVLIAQAVLLTGSFGAGYWLLAALILPVVVRLVTLPSPPPILSKEERHAARVDPRLLALFVLFFMIITGSEGSFGGWIFTFTVKSGLANETVAAYVNAAYWGAFAIGRLIAIPIAIRVRPRAMLAASLFLLLGGLLLLLVFPQQPALLWVGTIWFGLGIAPAFPTTLTFAGRHMAVTGALTGWFFVGASMGGIIIPWLIGQLFETIGPVSVLLVLVGAVAVGFGIFGGILFYFSRLERRKPLAGRGRS